MNNNYTIITFQLRHIALQRSEQARVEFRAISCLLEHEMFVFLDESGFVSVSNILHVCLITTRKCYCMILLSVMFFRTRES